MECARKRDFTKGWLFCVSDALDNARTVYFWSTVWLDGKETFLCIAIPLGAAFLCFLSVNPVHDGPTHLAKVYHYSNMLLGWNENDETGYVSLKADEKECFDSAYSEIYRENEQAQVAWETYHDFGVRAQDNSLYTSHQFRETSASSIWEYFPGVIGMTIGRCIGTGARFNILLTKLFFTVFISWRFFWQ